MDIGGSCSSDTISNGEGETVACPVCTLYLREGISLQKHLDTHPKEQVIEALIKVSNVGNLIQGQTSVPIQPTVHPPSAQNTPAHIPSQNPYPIGLFECPPINTMMPPQFASFSYQQFVNNGTMMIPQYAMAPQNNQMMQMFYNPYGMYSQQQIPAVQMISPIAPIPTTTTLTSMSSMTSRFKTTNTTNETSIQNVVVPSSDCTDKDLPQTEQQEETVLPDIEPASTPHSTLITKQNQLLDINENTGSIAGSDQHAEEQQHVEIRIGVNDNQESILLDIPNTGVNFTEKSKTPDKDCLYENTVGVEKESQYRNDYEGNRNESYKDHTSSPVSKIIEEQRQKKEEELSMQVDESGIQSHRSEKEPEVEQLECILSNIIESEFPNKKVEKEHTHTEKEKKDSTEIRMELEEVDISKVSYDIWKDNKANQMYSYKHSQSMPSSPVMLKKYHRTLSRTSLPDFDSTQNVCVYPVEFDINVLQQSENNDNCRKPSNSEEINVCKDKYLKIGHVENVGNQRERSHTPSSHISGISELKISNDDESEPCSPASVHSFSNIDTDSQTEDCEDFINVETRVENIPIDCSKIDTENNSDCQKNNGITEGLGRQKRIEVDRSMNRCYSVTAFPISMDTVSPITTHVSDPLSEELENTHNLMNISESVDQPTSTNSAKSFQICKTQVQKPMAELLNISEDAHVGPMNVFEFDGLQILVPSTFISDSSQKAVSGTSQQSLASSEGGVGIDEEIKSVNMRADESMPPRGELSEQESNGCTEQSAWQLYMGQESSRVSTSYDLMARESWEESEGSDNEMGVPLLDSRSLATHFASSLFLDRDRKTPTRRMFKCTYCVEVFECPKERRVHITTVHKEASSTSMNGNSTEQHEIKDIKLLDGRANVFEDIFTPGLHGQQTYHHQQPLLHQLQPPQRGNLSKVENDSKMDGLGISTNTDVVCNICNRRFAGENSLQMHHRRIHEIADGIKRIRENAKCQICNEEFPSVIAFNAHLKVHPLECGQCGKYFYRKQNFKLHMKRHLGIKPFPCTVCDKAFLTKQKLDEHMNGHTGNAPVKCNLCNETFRRYSNLTQHKNRHHLNIKKKLKDYICHCGEVFHTKKKLAWHKETHDDKPKACTYCNERFIHMASLTRHMRRAHNRRFVPDAQRENENVECPICKCIYLRSSLAVHMRVHNGERPYECQVCSKAFSTKWNLQLHKWTHAARSAKPFKCNQCSAAFYRHSDYTAHMNSHRNVRPYTCNYCGAQFIRKYNCLRHVKEHEENKAYTCDVCNKTFHRSYYLKEHLRVHSGARPYTCHICGKSSSTKSNHNKHVRIHHAREPVNTEN